MALSPFMDYSLGQVLSLNVVRNAGGTASSVLLARVRRLHTRSMSCTMVVDVVDEQSVSQKHGVAFLKLFDRRFSDSLREQSGVKPWTKELEQAYIDWVSGGEMSTFLHNRNHLCQYMEDDWNDAEKETYMAYELFHMFNKEVAAYAAMTQHQGSLVPKFLEVVDFAISGPESVDAPGCGGFDQFRVKGILLDYIEGCSMGKIGHHFPRSRWQYIVDEGLRIVRIMQKMNILNEDVAEWNFVVTEASDVDQVDNQGEPVKPHLWMIDLAMCRTRGVDESDGDWFRDKHHSNEEVFAGTMKNILKAYHDFDLNFKLTLQYLKYGDKFCDGCDGNLVRYNPFALISRSYGQSSIPR